MGMDLEGLARMFNKNTNGKGNSNEVFSKLFELLATEKGKKVLAMLLADGGEQLKSAAERAKVGDTSGVFEIITKIGSTKEGAEILAEFSKNG